MDISNICPKPNLSAVAVPEAASRVLSLDKLRRALDYHDTTLERVLAFGMDTRIFLRDFISRSGVKGTELLCWESAEHRAGLAELTEAWFFPNHDGGSTYWPNDPTHPNHNKLQFTVDMIRIIGLMMQFFYRINIRANRNQRYNYQRPQGMPSTTDRPLGSSENPIEIPSHQGSQESAPTHHGQTFIQNDKKSVKYECDAEVREVQPDEANQQPSGFDPGRIGKAPQLPSSQSRDCGSLAGTNISGLPVERNRPEDESTTNDGIAAGGQLLRKRKHVGMAEHARAKGSDASDDDGDVPSTAGSSQATMAASAGRMPANTHEEEAIGDTIRVQTSRPLDSETASHSSIEEPRGAQKQKTVSARSVTLGETVADTAAYTRLDSHDDLFQGQNTSESLEPAGHEPNDDLIMPVVKIIDAEGHNIGSMRRIKLWNDSVEAILAKPIQRNVKIRQGRKFTDGDLAAIYKVNKTKGIRWLSVMIQATGVVQTRRCHCCQKNQGAFAECTVLGGSLFPRCGNCEWNRQGCHGAVPGGSSEVDVDAAVSAACTVAEEQENRGGGSQNCSDVENEDDTPAAPVNECITRQIRAEVATPTWTAVNSQPRGVDVTAQTLSAKTVQTCAIEASEMLTTGELQTPQNSYAPTRYPQTQAAKPAQVQTTEACQTPEVAAPTQDPRQQAARTQGSRIQAFQSPGHDFLAPQTQGPLTEGRVASVLDGPIAHVPGAQSQDPQTQTSQVQGAQAQVPPIQLPRMQLFETTHAHIQTPHTQARQTQGPQKQSPHMAVPPLQNIHLQTAHPPAVQMQDSHTPAPYFQAPHLQTFYPQEPQSRAPLLHTLQAQHPRSQTPPWQAIPPHVPQAPFSWAPDANTQPNTTPQTQPNHIHGYPVQVPHVRGRPLQSSHGQVSFPQDSQIQFAEIETPWLLGNRFRAAEQDDCQFRSQIAEHRAAQSRGTHEPTLQMWADANVDAARPAARPAALPTSTQAYWIQEREATHPQADVLPQPQFLHSHGPETRAGSARVEASPLLADQTRAMPAVQANDDGATRVPKRKYQAYVSEDTGADEEVVLSSHRSSSPGIGSARPTINAPGSTAGRVDGESEPTISQSEPVISRSEPVISRSEPAVLMLYSVIKTRTPKYKEVKWRLQGSFQQLTLEQFKDQVPLTLCSEAKGFRFKFTGPGVDLFDTVERCSEMEFQYMKTRLGAAVEQGLLHAESSSSQCEAFSLLIEEWRDGSAEVEDRVREAAFKW